MHESATLVVETYELALTLRGLRDVVVGKIDLLWQDFICQCVPRDEVQPAAKQ